MMTNAFVYVDACKSITQLLDVIGEPARVQILFVLGNGDACVCHLEAALHLRQASISQHLMVLRHAGLVSTRRDGRHIFYHLVQPDVLQLLEQAANISAINPDFLHDLAVRPMPGCSCPQCNPGLEPESICKKVK